MALESAQSFVKKMYEDDEFLKQIYQVDGFVGGKANDPNAAANQSIKIAEIAPELGYEFTQSEYDEANNAYIKQLGAWKGIKVMFHMAKVIKAAEKEAKK